VGGVDEVGRGCIAGPVVAAVCVAEPNFPPPVWMDGVRDSKLLTEGARERLEREIRGFEGLRVGIGWCSPAEIDAWNILRASHVAMVRAVEACPGPRPDGLLVDGNLLPREWQQGVVALPVVKGDQQSMLIACASIVAKVYRDRWMARLETEFPGYGHAVHKGYPTARHLIALSELGVTAIHRQSFGPVRNTLQRTAPKIEDIAKTE
jgi:ribonuclease HII